LLATWRAEVTFAEFLYTDKHDSIGSNNIWKR